MLKALHATGVRRLVTLLASSAATAALLVSPGIAAPPAAAESPTASQAHGAVGAIADTPTGEVKALAQGNGVTYMGGTFRSVGANTGGGAAVDQESAVVDRTFPGVQGQVFAAAPDGNGGFYIGGEFKLINGLARNNAARILADGTLDPRWNPSVNGPVNALAVSGTQVYLGGRFSQINDYLAIDNAAAVDRFTGAATEWNPGPDNFVNSLAVSGSTVYLGGTFTTINGDVPRRNTAAVSADTGTAKPWNPDPNGNISAVAVSGATVYLGGWFTAINGNVPRNYAAAVDAVSGQVTDWNPRPDNGVMAMLVAGPTVYLGGWFGNVNGGLPRSRAAAVDGATGVANAWDPNVGAAVDAIAVAGSTVYLSGSFQWVNAFATKRNRVAAVDASSGLVKQWDPNVLAQGRIRALAVSGTRVYVGGLMTHCNLVTRDFAAAVDSNGRLTDWNPEPGSAVFDIEATADAVYLAGQFTTVNGATARNGAAAVDPVSGAVNGWHPNLNERAEVIVAVGSTVYLGGRFTTVNGGVTRNRAAAVDATTGTVTPWDPNVDNSVEAIAISGSTVFLGGSFTHANGLNQRRYVAAVNAETGMLTPWAPDASARVTCLAVAGSTVYLGGLFLTVGGSDRRFAAAVDNQSGAVTPWRPDHGADGVFALAVAGGTVYLGSTGPGALTAVDSLTGSDTGWDPPLQQPWDPSLGMSITVDDLMVNDGGVVVAGAFPGAARNLQAPVGTNVAWLSRDVGIPTEFISFPPVRVVDTRVNPGDPLDADHYIVLDVSTALPEGASALAFNITASSQTASGYLDVAPYGAPPGTSTVNWSAPLETIANGHIAKLSADRKLQITLESTGTTHVVLDVTGFFMPAGSRGATVYASANRRIYDSRTSKNPLQPGASRVLNINTGGTALPVAPEAAAVNVTATGTSGSGVFTVARDRSTDTSTINWTGGAQSVANAVITDVAPNGDFTVTNNGKTPADVVVDLTGVFMPTSESAPGARFYAMDPERTYDSRFDPAGELSGGQSRTTTSPIPADASAVVLNATVTGTHGTGYLSVTPPGVAVPTTSTVNWYRSPTTRANGSIIPTESAANRSYVGGEFSCHYLFDTAGYFR